ncbi:MAG: hypothetical protein M1823_003142 [Watsoniomyces obsoletus]|nr:MAG: hypothetical protein M1823_003142 [Watsoniomyces obsoletus]
MFSAEPKLHVRRPSPTSVEFIVSTQPTRHTLSACVLAFSVVLLRLAVGSIVVLLLWARFLDSNVPSRVPQWPLFREHLLSQKLWSIAAEQEWWKIILVALVLTYAVFHRGYCEESLLVLGGLGVQTSSSSSTYLSTPTTRFIPTSMVQDIFIHEAFKGFEVKFYVAIVVKGEDEVVVVFPKLLPRRHILEQVWRGARACLYETKLEANKN